MLLELREIQPEALPINFLLPIKGTPLGDADLSTLTTSYCLKVLCLARLLVPKADIRCAAGREVYFKGEEKNLLHDMVKQICEKNHIPFQRFVNRSDVRGGGTLGAVASTLVPVKTVDIGIPLLAMHSARELMGREDFDALTEVVTQFFT